MYGIRNEFLIIYIARIKINDEEKRLRNGLKKKDTLKALKMVMKDGKKVPFYAADGKGKMNKGGMMKKGYGWYEKDGKRWFLSPCC